MSTEQLGSPFTAEIYEPHCSLGTLRCKQCKAKRAAWNYAQNCKDPVWLEAKRAKAKVAHLARVANKPKKGRPQPPPEGCTPDNPCKKAGVKKCHLCIERKKQERNENRRVAVKSPTGKFKHEYAPHCELGGKKCGECLRVQRAERYKRIMADPVTRAARIAVMKECRRKRLAKKGKTARPDTGRGLGASQNYSDGPTGPRAPLRASWAEKPMPTGKGFTNRSARKEWDETPRPMKHYVRDCCLAKGELIWHQIWGSGECVSDIVDGRIQVEFGDATRSLKASEPVPEVKYNFQDLLDE